MKTLHAINKRKFEIFLWVVGTAFCFWLLLGPIKNYQRPYTGEGLHTIRLHPN